MAALLQPVGLPGLGSLFLQHLGVIQYFQAWDLTDDILSGKRKAAGNMVLKREFCVKSEKR